MNSRVVRSVVAILAGWITGSAGCLITIMAIPIFNSEIFQAGVRLSTGWLLIILSISAVYSIIGGYVTAAVARRNEIEHAMGLTVLVLVISGISTFRGNDASQVATWYMVAGVILVIPAILLGGWLRMEQRLLPEKRSRAIIRVVDSMRLPTAVAASFATLVTVVFVGFFGGGILILALPSSLGTPALMFFLYASLPFGAFLSAVVFAKINRRERGTVVPVLHADAEDGGCGHSQSCG